MRTRHEKYRARLAEIRRHQSKIGRQREAARDFILSRADALSWREQDFLLLAYGLIEVRRESIRNIGYRLTMTPPQSARFHIQALVHLFADFKGKAPAQLVAAHARALRYEAVELPKLKARETTVRAIRLGLLEKGPCRDCGTTKVDAHHPDYSTPLTVIWLCRSCHSKEHQRLKAEKAA